MSSSGLLHPSINKWVAITVTGASSIIGYSVRNFWKQPVQEAKRLPFPEIALLSIETKEEETLAPSEKIEFEEVKTPEPKINKPTPEKTQTPKPKPKIIKNKEIETYPIDPKYFATVKSHSMAYKYKDNVLLVNDQHRIWQARSKKLKEMARKNGGTYFWTYWGGYLREKHLTPKFAHKFCTLALSYSEWTTFWTIGNNKKYMDFLWDICGRDDKTKPEGWWYA